MPTRITAKTVTLKCARCPATISATISGDQTAGISRAVERITQQARQDGWDLDTDLCPNHT